jgi:NAD kinase
MLSAHCGLRQLSCLSLPPLSKPVVAMQWSASHPPRAVLVIKKHHDPQITTEVRAMCEWLRDHCGLKVYVEPAVAQDELKGFEAFPLIPGCGAYAHSPSAAATSSSAASASASSSSSSAAAAAAATHKKPCGCGCDAPSSSDSADGGPCSIVDLCITVGGDGTLLYLNSLLNCDGPVPPVLAFARGTACHLLCTPPPLFRVVCGVMM